MICFLSEDVGKSSPKSGRSSFCPLKLFMLGSLDGHILYQREKIIDCPEAQPSLPSKNVGC